MPLMKNKLENGIAGLQDPNQPEDVPDAAKKWADFVFNYATGGMAGVTMPQFAGYPKLLETAFLGAMEGGKFLEMLGTNLQPMWQAAIWAGTGFTGVTAAAIGKTLDSSVVIAGEAILAGAPADKEIANAIDVWTKTITVSLTNVSSGATSVVGVL